MFINSFDNNQSIVPLLGTNETDIYNYDGLNSEENLIWNQAVPKSPQEALKYMEESLGVLKKNFTYSNKYNNIPYLGKAHSKLNEDIKKDYADTYDSFAEYIDEQTKKVEKKYVFMSESPDINLG